MSEEDRELLLDASFNLSYFVELAGNLVLILTTEPPEDEKKATGRNRAIEEMVSQLEEGIPPVITTLEDHLWEFAGVSDLVCYPVEQIPADSIETEKFPINSSDIVGTSGHAAGVSFLKYNCLGTDFWIDRQDSDDFWLPLPPVFDVDRLLVQIEWERMRVFKSAVVGKTGSKVVDYSYDYMKDKTTLRRTRLNEYIDGAAETFPDLEITRGRNVRYKKEQVIAILDYILQSKDRGERGPIRHVMNAVAKEYHRLKTDT
ncbi:MAG: hypothetical protein CME32_08720 [Gimesia sp.]|nr:hypothetical protein [Gimesia sp.]